MRTSIIGAGNVAWHLAHALEDAGHGIEEIWSRKFLNAKKLADEMYDSKAVEELNFSESKAKMFVIAIADDAIESVVEQMVLPENAIVVHTSGTKSLAEFEKWLRIYSDVKVQSGILYPLQTFSKKVKIDFEEQVPICIEASEQITEDILVKIAQDLSELTYIVTSKERRILHLAAVMACNFTNHLLAISKEILEDEELDFSMLRPLINETFRKAITTQDPADVQTGPARRRDTETIEKHLTVLKNKNENYQKIYKAITQSIIEKYELNLRNND